MKTRVYLPSYLGRCAATGFQEQDLFRIAKEGGQSLCICLLKTVVLSWLDWEFLSCIDFVLIFWFTADLLAWDWEVLWEWLCCKYRVWYGRLWISLLASATNKGREISLHSLNFVLCCPLFMEKHGITNDTLSRERLTIWKNIHSRKTRRSAGDHVREEQPHSPKWLL